MGVVALACADRLYAPVRAQFDLVLGQVQVQRAAAVTRLAHGAVARLERAQDAFKQWCRLLVRAAVEGFLRLVVCQAGR